MAYTALAWRRAVKVSEAAERQWRGVFFIILYYANRQQDSNIQ